MSKHIKGRGASIKTKNRFDQYFFQADEGSRVEDQEKVRTSILEIFPKSIVNPVPSPDINMNWSMNPYQGCEHGCAYCYARPTHEYLGYNGGVDFESVLMVKKNAAQLLREKLKTKSWMGEPIMLSGNTDCYQPIERKLKITRELLKVCLEFRNPVGIITKNSLVERDLDILEQLAKLNLVHVVLSITTLQEDLRQILEPRTSSSKAKLRTLETLSKSQIPVAVMMAPIIPAINSSEILTLAETVKNAGAKAINYTIVRLNGCVEEVFTDWLERHFPDRKQKVLKQIAECQGGEVHNSKFKVRMRGEGNMANVISQQFKIARNRFDLNSSLSPLNHKLFVRKNQFQLDL